MKSDEWRTPDWLFKELDEEFNFNIDLCANKENSKCLLWFEDYLKGKEGGVDFTAKFKDYVEIYDLKCAFMNPPYSNPKPFIEKAWEDSKHCKIVLLVKVDTSTRWWAVFWDYLLHKPKPGCKVRFLPKRVKFDLPPGYTGKVSGPSFPSAIVIMDRHIVNRRNL